MYATNLLCQICVTLPPPYELPWSTRISTQIHDGSCTEESAYYTLNRDVWHYLRHIVILYYHPLCHLSVTLPPDYSDCLQFQQNYDGCQSQASTVAFDMLVKLYALAVYAII